jgi:hypothetical protein
MSQSNRIPDTHAEAWSLLPFLVNGRITPEDREWVELHVQSCAECQRELEEQLPLAEQMRESEIPFATSEQRAFAKLWTRIEASEGALPAEDDLSTSRPVNARPRRTVRWLAAAVIVQAIGLALLGVSVLNSSDSANGYRTVASAQGQVTGPAVRLVFTSDTSIAQVANILAEHDLQLIGGPGAAGVFTAAIMDASRTRSAQAVAEALQGNAQIEFAEPVAP